MPRLGLSRLRPLRQFLLSSSSSSPACSHSPSPAPFSCSLLNSNFHHSHESMESPLRFGSEHASGSSVSAPLGNCRTFRAARMELERIAGTVVATGKEAIGSVNDFRSGVGLSDAEGAVKVGKEAELVCNSSEEEEDEGDKEERFSCEGVDEGILEDAEPHADPEGRSYLHVLTVEEVQVVLEKTRADDVQVIPVRDLCEWADHLVVASGHSGRHLRGIADAICFEVKKRSTNVGDNVYPTVEGRESEEWMVVDCGSIVVHVFRDDIRGEYNLEEMWRKRRPANIKDIGI